MEIASAKRNKFVKRKRWLWPKMNLGDLILSTSLQLKLTGKSAVHFQSFFNVSMESLRNTTRTRYIKEQVRGYWLCLLPSLRIMNQGLLANFHKL